MEKGVQFISLVQLERGFLFEKGLPCANPLGSTVEKRAMFPSWDPCEKEGQRAIGGRKARGHGGNGEIPRKIGCRAKTVIREGKTG